MHLLRRFVLLPALLFISIISFAQNNFWKDAPATAVRNGTLKRVIIPTRFRPLQLDTSSMLQFLRSVPKEFANNQTASAIISLPMPDGLTQQFRISESFMMEPGLAAQFPGIKTYSGQGIEDASATIKLDWTPLGFHAMVFSPETGTYAIDPYAEKTTTEYISYYKKDLTPRGFLEENFSMKKQMDRSLDIQQRTQAICAGGSLRSYRLAVACTGEYAVAVGATTKEQAVASIVTSINRVNGVYEKELSIRLVLVANNSKIVFLNPVTDRFTQNNNGTGLLNESQVVITDSIGSANFDIGHTFSTGAGGIASLGSACTNANKAKGVTGLEKPKGDAYDIDYVAHEIGHQVGAYHPFNATTGNCAGNRSANSAVEPGSGSTIMAYAGICLSSNNLQPNSDAYFHAINFDEINTFLLSGTGSCATVISTGNNPPVANAGNDYIIPMSTPFILTGSATDPNGDPLTYSWEQVDVGPEGNWNAPMGNAPIFRSFTPTNSPVRQFPRAANLVNNSVTIGELLPSYERNMSFRFTARDNRAVGGGRCSDDMNISVVGGEPFVVTSPNTATSWHVGDFKTITWEVSNTRIAPINCANVSIQLSTDGGLTFPITLIASTSNDGSEEIKVPNNLTSSARIRIMAVDNIFFDISNVNFTINTATIPEFVFNNPAPVTQCSGTNPSSSISTGAMAGYNTPVTLSASGNPAGSSVVFGTNPVSANGTSSITLQGSLAAGVYNITITGTSGSIIKTRVVQFKIGAPGTSPITVSPANDATGLSVNTSFTWQAGTGLLYNFVVSTTNTFSDIVQSANGISSDTYTLPSALQSDKKYFWRVAETNSCGAGPWSQVFSFTTASEICGDTIYSTVVPVTIPSSAATITSTITIPQGATIADIDVVGLKGTHSYVSDLTFTLTSPSGTSIILLSGQCGEQDNFDINFDDEASSGVVPCPPIGGLVRKPSQPLAAFKGENSSGIWTLSVEDDYDDDGGSLTNWGLKICTYAPVYTFIGNGAWSNAANWKNNLVPPQNLSAGNQIIIDPSTGGSCIVDVNQVISKGGTITVNPGKTMIINKSLSLL